MLKKKLTEEELIKKVDDYNIFNRYFGPFEIKSKTYKSVFRKDDKPSTGFFINSKNRIVYNDLCTSEKLGSIQFVAKLYGLTYGGAINKIAKDFGVIEGKDNTAVIAPIKLYRPQLKKEKAYEAVVDSKWTPQELAYWEQYAITPEELKENMVYACRELRINSRIIPNRLQELRFVYKINYIGGQEYIKIYTPYSTQYKWLGNVPLKVPFGAQELPFKSDTLIITKGQKDRIIWKKFFTDVIALQNESKDALDEELAEVLKNNYKTVYINFDVDKQWIKNPVTKEFEWRYLGKEHTTYYCEKYGWKYINVPNVYFDRFGIKDFSDLVKEKGLETFKQYLQWKKII